MSTIVTIQSTDVISSSRTDLNTNFSNLNADKIETSYLDTDTALTANSDSKIPSQKAVKAYVDSGGNQNASTTQRGLVQEATSAQIIAGTGAGSSGARLFVNPTQVAETGADKIAKIKSTGFLDSSIINVTVPFVTQDVPMINNADAPESCFITSDTTGSVIFRAYTTSSVGSSCTIQRLLKDTTTGNYYITNSTTLTIDTNSLRGLAVCGNYLYVFATISASNGCRRYDKADLANVTTITFSGTSRASVAFSDNTDLYVYNGSSGGFDRFTISGTTITNASSVTYTSGGFAVTSCICNGTNVWMSDSSGVNGAYTIRKYVLAGGAALSTSTPNFFMGAYLNGASINPNIFMGSSTVLGISWTFNWCSATANVGQGTHIVGIALP